MNMEVYQYTQILQTVSGELQNDLLKFRFSITNKIQDNYKAY